MVFASAERASHAAEDFYIRQHSFVSKKLSMRGLRPEGRSMMDDPVINIEHSATSRYVTVMFRFGETSTEYVAARFNDPGNPDETSEAERERQR